MSISYVFKIFNDYLSEKPDDTTANWFPVKNPWQLHLIVLLYFYIILIWGPKYMKNKTAFKLTTFISFYNVFQIISNASVIYAFLKNGMFTKFSPICNDLHKSPDARTYEIAEILFYTTLIKFVDLIETVVFLLRKKNNQISFLHVFHHSSILYVAYIGLKYYPSAISTFPTALNSFVHVIMYSYYFMSGYPSLQKISGWIKRYITMLQLTQFIIMCIYMSQCFSSRCPASEWYGAFSLFIVLMNIILFTNFYVQNYIKKSKRKHD